MTAASNIIQRRLLNALCTCGVLVVATASISFIIAGGSNTCTDGVMNRADIGEEPESFEAYLPLIMGAVSYTIRSLALLCSPLWLCGQAPEAFFGSARSLSDEIHQINRKYVCCISGAVFVEDFIIPHIIIQLFNYPLHFVYAANVFNVVCKAIYRAMMLMRRCSLILISYRCAVSWAYYSLDSLCVQYTVPVHRTEYLRTQAPFGNMLRSVRTLN